MFPMGGVPVYPAGHDRPITSMARHLLNTINTVFDEAGISLPARQYVAVGALSTVDKEQLVVMYGGTYAGLPGNEFTAPVGEEDPKSATFNVELWREMPALSMSGTAPSEEEIAAASEMVMDDSWWLLQSAFAANQRGPGVIARVGVNEPQGDYHGLSMIVEMNIP